MQGTQQNSHSLVRLAKLNPARSLTGRRQRQVGINRRADPVLEPKADQAGTGQDNGLKLSAVEFGEPRIDVAAKKTNLEIRTMPAQLTAAA